MMTNVNKICYTSFAVRLVALAVVMYFSKDLTTGFLSSDVVNDDVRYLMGAQNYARLAHSIIDVNALESAYLDVGDWSVIGYEFKLWYWIVSISMYIFHSEVAVRLLNILFAVASVKCIYDICDKLYGMRVATLASKLYAFLPYPVFFSCFLYKDQFYTLLVLLMLRIVLLKQERMRLKDFLCLTGILAVSTFIRSGLSFFIALLLGLIYLNYAKETLKRWYTVVLFLIGIVGIVVLWVYSMDSIETKYMAYVVDKNSGGGAISLVEIRTMGDIWKYPFALLFAMLLPINNTGGLTSWIELVGYLNIVILPVALGSLFYTIYWAYKKDVFFWCIQLL